AGLIKSIAKTIKKRIVIRTDPSVRKPHEIAKRIVEAMTPPEAEISEISFDDVLGEMWTRAKKPGYVIGKDGSLLRRILIETGWRPVILRSPPIRSRIVEGVMKQLLKESVERRRILRGVGERIHRDVVFENNYVRITALGAFKEVGRSAILVETAESRVLLDLGINPGGTDPATAFPRIDIPALRPDTLDAVVITHAHLDHCGLVPLLFKYGYEGPVYVTRATRDIMLLVQQDFLEVTGREGGIAPYTSREIRKMLLHTIPLDYEEVTDIAPDIRLTFYNAGHILGSAMVHLHIGRGLHNILYTGDFKYSRTKLLNRAHDTFLRVETLIMESTYGATLQPSRE
ncbi:TPA: MBL fold metallo-hydrolase, partial [Candidatus Micrarchaeota archaeon]|nr:MBL fold metallo-hydrolase [Candidatus Micrarchaeota archaeon]